MLLDFIRPRFSFCDTRKCNQDLEIHEPQQCAHISCKYLFSWRYPWFPLFLIFKKYIKMPYFHSVPHSQAFRVFYKESSIDITNGLPGESITRGWITVSPISLPQESPLIIICSILWHLLRLHLARNFDWQETESPAEIVLSWTIMSPVIQVLLLHCFVIPVLVSF